MTQPVFVDAKRDLLGKLIDYAGLFPPASLPLRSAVTEYRTARSGPHGWMLGAFVAPASMLDRLAGALVATMAAGEDPWEVGVVLDGDPGTAAAHVGAFEAELAPAVRIAGLEIPVPAAVADGRPAGDAVGLIGPAARAGSSPSGPAVKFLEIPTSSATRAGMSRAVAAIDRARRSNGAPLGAKLRCGGAAPELFPQPGLVAAFIVACRDRNIRYKLSAGLHHPVRAPDAGLGVTRHGFLNLLIAAGLAENGADAAVVEAVVAEEDPAALKVGAAGIAWRDVRAGAAVVKRMRGSRLASFSSCRFDEPVGGLESAAILRPVPT